VNLGPSKRPVDSEPGGMLAMPDFSAYFRPMTTDQPDGPKALRPPISPPGSPPDLPPQDPSSGDLDLATTGLE
jgi:hypothetical protein